MNCDVCGTELTEFNARSFRHVHDVGNCAQVLLAQRDAARREALLLANDVDDLMGTLRCIASPEYTREEARRQAHLALERLKRRGV
jgi:hypothetical protein